MADGDYERRDSRVGELRRLQRIIDEAKEKKKDLVRAAECRQLPKNG